MTLRFAITMRSMTREYPGGIVETYDALSQDWCRFLGKAFPGCSCLFLPNTPGMAQKILQENSVQTLILSGGEDWGKFPERDATESALLEWAVNTELPVLGVCRGMQVINLFYGGALTRLPGGHVATRHNLIYAPNSAEYFPKEVNSFHNNGIDPDCLSASLMPLAKAPDGSIEAMQHNEKAVIGIMWHPERETDPSDYDLALINKLLASSRRVFP